MCGLVVSEALAPWQSNLTCTGCRFKRRGFQGPSHGIREFSGLINPPQSALLAVGEIRERPFVDQGKVGIRPEMSLTLAADHRVVDGAEGARFLGALRNSLTGL